MHRRRLLYTTTTALTAVLAGCDSTSTRTSTGTDTSQESTATATQTATRTATPDESETVVAPIQDLWGAYNAEDADGFAGTFHPESPDAIDTDEIEFQGTVSIDNTTVVDRAADTATVEADLTFTSDSRTESHTHTYELRQYQGEWRIWTVTVEGQDSEPTAPQVSFRMEYDASATTGTDTGVLTITHSGGDTVEGSQLSIGGSGITAPDGAEPDVTQSGTAWPSATGETDVSAGDTVTVGVSSDCVVRVVWTAADGDTSSVLARYEGPGT